MEKKQLINEVVLGTKELESTVEKVTKLVLEGRVKPKVDEAIKKIFEEDEMGGMSQNFMKKEDAKEEVDFEDEGEGEEKVELDLDDIDSEVKEEVDDEPINIDKIHEEEEDMFEAKDKDEEKEEDVPDDKELDEVYKRVLKEVEVGKLPSDVTPVEKAKEAPEKDWQEGEAEGKPVATVKESKTLRKLLAIHRNVVKENKVLKAQLRKTVGQINEINLFNKKLLMSMKLFNEHNLSGREQKAILSDFDSAKTISEAKATYKAYAKSLTMGKAKMNENISRKIGMPNRTVIKETREDRRDDNTVDARMMELANLNEDE